MRIGIPKGSYVATFGYAELEPVAASDSERVLPADFTPRAIARRRILPMRKPPLWWIASITAILLLVLAWLVPVLVDRAIGGAQVASNGPAILILPFESGGGDGHAFVARGITAELIGPLAPQDVLGQTPTLETGAKPDFILSGSATTVGGKIYISAALAESSTGRYLWSWNVERPLAGPDLIAAEAAIAGEIADGIKPLMSAAAD